MISWPHGLGTLTICTRPDPAVRCALEPPDACLVALLSDLFCVMHKYLCTCSAEPLRGGHAFCPLVPHDSLAEASSAPYRHTRPVYQLRPARICKPTGPFE